MATKTFKVSLSLDNPRIIQSGINVRSFDKQSIKIAIELTKDSQVYQIPTDAQIKISLLKLARQEQKIILDVPFTSAEAIEWIVPDYLDGYQGDVRVGVYLIVGTENIDVGYFNITSSVSDIDSAAEEFTESVLQGWAIEDLTALLPKFQEVIDETTGKDVISAPEIILARNGETNLKARLDKDQQQVTAQLAQTIRIDESNLSLNNFNEHDRAVIQGLAEGEINAVLGERNVETENLANKAVSPDKTNFAVEYPFGINLLDDSKSTTNETGTHKYSPRIEIPGNEHISISTLGHREPQITNIKLYNSNGEELTPPTTQSVYGTTRSGKFFTSPSDAHSLDFTYQVLSGTGATLVSEPMVNLSEYPYLSDYEPYIPGFKFTKDDYMNKEDVLSYQQTDFVEKVAFGINLLDESLSVDLDLTTKKSEMLSIEENKPINITVNGSNHAYVRNITFFDKNFNVLETPSSTHTTAQNQSTIHLLSPFNAKHLQFNYQFASSAGVPVISKVMVYYGDASSIKIYEEYRGGLQFSDAGGQGEHSKTLYVSPDGDDTNDGLSELTPFKTFARASEEKPHTIFAKRGTYDADSLIVNNQKEFNLLPYDNDLVYSHDIPVRPKIVIDNGDVLDNLTSVDGILEKTYEGGVFFHEVFVAKTVAPMMSDVSPRAVLWQEFEDETLNSKLTPKLTIDEVVANVGSFYWDGTKIYINPLAGTPTRFVSVKSAESVLKIENVIELKIVDVVLLYQFYSNIIINNVADSMIKNTYAKYANAGQGFALNNLNANLYNCEAFKVSGDGFNMHLYGDTNFYNCKATYCYDDGMSHHSGCTGTVNGGVYSFNGKGGIIPAYGANVDIYDTFCQGNRYGISYHSTDNGHFDGKGHIANNTLVDNQVGLRVDPKSKVTAINTTYANNVVDKQINGDFSEW